MKALKAGKIDTGHAYVHPEEISGMLDAQPYHAIDTINWKEFSHLPETTFSVAHSGTEIYLKFRVREKWFVAEKLNDNENVYEDSCVEFFVSPGSDGIYYNFEFNGIGTCLMGSGTGRTDSKRVDPALISKIRRLPSAGRMPVSQKEDYFTWDLTVAIPVSVFFRHSIDRLGGRRFMANFYKCGDRTKVPHYVTWNPVNTGKPDFHRPEYFGELMFE